jgi:signal peptidase I
MSAPVKTPAPVKAPAPVKVPARWKRLLADLLPLLLVFVARGSLADHYHVPSGSMEPTLQVRDHLAVDKRAYGVRVPLTRVWLTHTEPRRGDVVVFASPVDGTVLVKRLVGLPGDTVAFAGGHLLLDGEPVPQEAGEGGARLERLPGAVHPLHPEAFQGPPMAPVTIPEGHFLMLGDHRGNSTDGRSFGLVPRDHLLGRAVAVLYSPEREGLAWHERLWLPLTPAEGEQPDPRLTR